MTDAEAVRTALLQADPKLSRYNPLPRVLCFDDFDDGVNGWTELVGNHDGTWTTYSPTGATFGRPRSLTSHSSTWALMARCPATTR